MATSPSAVCLNCGAALTGGYCARCGQKAVNPDLTLKGFLHETTHELTHWDGKIPATLKTLFLKPGVLTADFLAGRRGRWLTPLRVYLICSVALFGSRAMVDEFGIRTPREIAGVSFRRAEGAGPLTPEERQLIAEGLPGRIIGVERLERAMTDTRRFNREFEAAIPKAMFILLPMFALITNLAWRKRYPRYPVHLYLALHVHSAVFGAMAAISIVAGFIPSLALALAVGLLFPAYTAWYTLKALHHIFRDSWPKTIVKAVLIAAAYFSSLVVVLMMLLVYAVSKM